MKCEKLNVTIEITFNKLLQIMYIKLRLKREKKGFVAVNLIANKKYTSFL